MMERKECLLQAVRGQRAPILGYYNLRSRQARHKGQRVWNLSPLCDMDFPESDGQEVGEKTQINNLVVLEDLSRKWQKAVSSTMGNATGRELRNKYPV